MTQVVLAPLDTFREAFAEAMKDGKIDEEEMKELLEPIAAGAEEAAEALKRGNEVLNQQIKQQQQFIDMLQGQRDKELEARQKATDVFMKGAELRFKLEAKNYLRTKRSWKTKTSAAGFTRYY